MHAHDSNTAGAPIRPTGTGVKDVSAAEFIAEYAAHLKDTGAVDLPKYVEYAKTGHHKELSPIENDWFYTRVAAVARQMYINPGSGVGALARKFGGQKHGDVCRPRTVRASRKVIRDALHALEKAGVLGMKEEAREDEEDQEDLGSIRLGRYVTDSGKRDLDRIARAAAAKALANIAEIRGASAAAAEEEEEEGDEEDEEGA